MRRDNLHMNKKYNIVIFVLTILTCALLIISYTLYEENDKTISILDDGLSHNLLSSLEYFNELEEMIPRWKEVKYLNNSDYYIFETQNAKSNITEMIRNYSYITDKKIVNPEALLKWLDDIQLLFIRYKDGEHAYFSSVDIEYISNLEMQVKELNDLSSSIFGYDEGMEEPDLNRAYKIEFLRDKRWVEWLDKAGEIISKDR
jgi:hypothetical protein